MLLPKLVSTLVAKNDRKQKTMHEATLRDTSTMKYLAVFIALCLVGSSVGQTTTAADPGTTTAAASGTTTAAAPGAVLSLISPHNGPCSGAVSVSIFGFDFRTQDPSSGIKKDGTACERSLWISETTLICKTTRSAAFGAVSYTHLRAHET